MKEIRGYDAIRRMRYISLQEDGYFTIYHLTADLTKGVTSGWRKVEKCRLRKALPTRKYVTDSDHYLPYENIDTGEEKMCFKILLRYIVFPPETEVLKVNWL